MSAARAWAEERAPVAGAWLREAAVAASEDPRSAAPNLGALWRAVVDGRYRLLECFEHGARRYCVLHENLDVLRPTVALTDRERRLAEAVGHGESEKSVSFALGVTPSAVSSLMKSTLAKLGLRSKIDLVLLVSALCPAGLAGHDRPVDRPCDASMAR